MNDRVIVSAEIGAAYKGRSRSMRWHCQQHCGDHDFIHWENYPPGCPPHHEKQYAFKIFALRDAVERGYRRLLWMDTVYMPVAPIDPLWADVGRNGWYAPKQGTSVVGTWATDECLTLMGFDRETAMTITLAFSGLVGLDLDHPVGASVWQQWQEAYELGAFNGPHINTPGRPFERWGNKFRGHCSNDPRVEGHRHDETALSLILHRLGFEPSENPEVLFGCVGMHLPCPRQT